MKKVFLCAVVLLFIAGLPAALHADGGVVATPDSTTIKADISMYRLAVGAKAARGVKNVLFGWTELPKRIVDVTQETRNPFWGIFAGTFQGTLKAMARTASGVSDVVTAPLTPEKGPYIQPDIDVE